MFFLKYTQVFTVHFIINISVFTILASTAFANHNPEHSVTLPKKTLSSSKARKPVSLPDRSIRETIYSHFNSISFDRYRRHDGTLNWREMTRAYALRPTSGLISFTLAMYLKEMVAVMKTGKRERIDEFVDGLLATDFYIKYGISRINQRIAEIAYTRSLQRYVKPKHISESMKTGLIMATGAALPMIIDGRFAGQAYAISLASLGLSTTAVKAGIGTLDWVKDLKTAKQTGDLYRLGQNTKNLAKLGGWFFNIAEQAVIIYYTEQIEERLKSFNDYFTAQEKLKKAVLSFYEKVTDSDVTVLTIKKAVDDYDDAWNGYRAYLYNPLVQDETDFLLKLKKVARKAKLLDDDRNNLISKLPAHKSLYNQAVQRHGSVEKYSQHLINQDRLQIKRFITVEYKNYNERRQKHLQEIYFERHRQRPLINKKDTVSLTLLKSVLRNVSKNRLETYDDEAVILSSIIKTAKLQGNRALARILLVKLTNLWNIKAAEKQLVIVDNDSKFNHRMVEKQHRENITQ